MPRLQLDAMDVRFGHEIGIRALSLSVGRGETVAIVGRSGAGKSSLLRAVAGLDPVAEGRVLIDGTDRSSAPPEKRGAVYLHQVPLLFPHLSVGENVAFPLRVRRDAPDQIPQRVSEVLGALGMGAFHSRAPNTLSGGQRHRVALARAIAGKPPVLLLDEPLTGLDPALRDEVLTAIRQAAAEYDPATLYITHDLAEAGAVADRIGVLIDGALAQVASPEELFRRPDSIPVAEFVGFTNRVEGESDGSTFTAPGWSLPLQTDVRGQAVLLFRPAALRLDSNGPLPGTIEGVTHTPAGQMLRVRFGRDQLDAVAHDSVVALPGTAAFTLDSSGVLLFRG